MREVEFRGINIETGNWVYGTYLKHQTYMPYPIGVDHSKEEDYVHLILTSGFADWGMKRGIDCYTVLKESVGQYTGLKDKNGKKIYEGDILKFYNDVDYIVKPGYAEVIFEDGTFACKHFKYGIECLVNMDVVDMDITVAGNIYENPELLSQNIY